MAEFRKPRAMSEKHKAFLDYWLESGNITQSAIKAGFSKKTAGAKGCQLLKDPRSKEYLEEMKRRVLERREHSIATTAEIAEYLTRVVRGEETEINFKGEQIAVSISERTKAAVELSKIVNVSVPTEERVIVVDGITRDVK